MHSSNKNFDIAIGGSAKFVYTLAEGQVAGLLTGQTTTYFVVRAIATTVTGLAGVFESRLVGLRVGAGPAIQAGLTVVTPMPVATLNGGGGLAVTFVGNTIEIDLTGDTVDLSTWALIVEHEQVSKL